MKIFLILLFLSLEVFANTSSVSVGDTFTTSTGAVFTRVQGPGKFGPAWRDSIGMLWSADQGQFKNSIISCDGYKCASEATEACQRISGELPWGQDFDRLRTYFEMRSKPDDKYFTARGLKEFLTLFPEMDSKTYWTINFVSSDTKDYSGAGVVFEKEWDGFTSKGYSILYAFDPSWMHHKVKCVFYK